MAELTAARAKLVKAVEQAFREGYLVGLDVVTTLDQADCDEAWLASKAKARLT